VGVVAEDELEEGQSFRNAYEETKFQAEKLVQRAMRDLPAVVLRPSAVVGDSTTGEMDLQRVEDPYALRVLLATSPYAGLLELPRGGAGPLHVVPVDYVVAAALAITDDEKAAGRTFHLVDPSPLSARRVREEVARGAGRQRTPPTVVAKAARALFHVPLVQQIARPREMAHGHLDQLVFFNSQNALELLEPAGIRCPPLNSYLPKLVEYLAALHRERPEETEAEDPLDMRS